MDALGEDLLLAAIDPSSGVLRCASHLPFGLMGAELVALADSGRIEVAEGRITVVAVATGTTGDRDLDAALARLAAARRSPKVRNWVSRPRRRIRQGYLDRLVEAGAVQRRGGVLRPRFTVTDGDRSAAVRSRLDAVAFAPDLAGAAQIDDAQAAFAGLANAIGLGVLLYRGRENREVRKRLREITRSHWAAEAVHRAAAAADSSAGG